MKHLYPATITENDLIKLSYSGLTIVWVYTASSNSILNMIGGGEKYTIRLLQENVNTIDELVEDLSFINAILYINSSSPSIQPSNWLHIHGWDKQDSGVIGILNGDVVYEEKVTPLQPGENYKALARCIVTYCDKCPLCGEFNLPQATECIHCSNNLSSDMS